MNRTLDEDRPPGEATVGPYDPGPVPLTLGVTGHRDLREVELPVIEARLVALFQDLKARYPDLPLRLISPLADGGDRIAARVARDHGIELVVPLPLSVEDYAGDFDPDSRDEFRALLGEAKVVDLSAGLACKSAAEDSAATSREQAYARAGAWTSDQCQILIALWDGKASVERGGTADVVDYHQFGQMLAHPGADEAASLDHRGLVPDDSDLVFHVACSRDRPEGLPIEGLTPGAVRWLTTDPERKETEDIPVSHHQMLVRIGAFNRDQARLSPDPDLQDRLPGWDEAQPPALQRIAAYFSRADRLAARFRRRYRSALRLLYLLAGLMGVAFIAYADLDRSSMILAYLALFFSGWWVYRVAVSRDWHRKFLDYRALAEGLRVQFYWRMAGVSSGADDGIVDDNFLQKQDIEIGWIRNVMRHAGTDIDDRGQLPHAAPKPEQGTVDAVAEHWIGTPGGAGQLGYFEARCERHYRHARRTDRLVSATLWLGIAITIVLAVFQQRLDDVVVTGMVAAMGMLPLAAAIREAYAHKLAEKELLKQYRFMLRIYRTARFRLDRCRNVEQKRQLLRALGEAALDEHAEWILLHRERPLEPGKL